MVNWFFLAFLFFLGLIRGSFFGLFVLSIRGRRGAVEIDASGNGFGGFRVYLAVDSHHPANIVLSPFDFAQGILFGTDLIDD